MFHSDLEASGKAVVFHSDSESKEWEKIGNVSLEYSSQILEETKRIQDPVQFIDRKQNVKEG